MDAIRPGTKVRIGGEIDGVVTGVMLRAHGPSGYEVSWWSGNSRTLAWFEPFEVTVHDDTDPKPLRVGFGG